MQRHACVSPRTLNPSTATTAMSNAHSSALVVLIAPRLRGVGGRCGGGVGEVWAGWARAQSHVRVCVLGDAINPNLTLNPKTLKR
jgi:hypothetical protein